MIGNDKFVALFGATPAGDLESLVPVVAHAIREGVAIVLNKPGQKVPVCTLSAADRNRADREAQTEAANVGDPRWHLRKHSCGTAHALTLESLGGDPSKVRTKVGAIIRRVAKAHGGTPNVGVELGLSRMLVIDVDTDAEREGFSADWKRRTGQSVPGMTVRSPGKVNNSGEWVHKNGGHYWFLIPDDVELPAGHGVYKSPSGWVAMWSGHQVLVPPSVRAEGPYQLIGQIETAHDWVLSEVISAAKARIDRAGKKSQLPDGTGDIDQYFAELPWTDLLIPDGWEDTGLVDRCSCPIFTAPGAHSHPKSATAHDAGCNRPEFDASMGHWPIHLWTDNPPEWLQSAVTRTGSKTFTKLQYIAWRDHDGGTRAALRELGLNGSDTEYTIGTVAELESALGEALRQKADPPPVTHDDLFDSAPAGDESADGEEVDSEDGTDGGVDDAPAEPTVDPVASFISLLRGSEELEDIEDPQFLIEGIMDMDTVTRIIGKSGHGKTFVMTDMSACIATGMPWHGHKTQQGLVVYMVAEGVRGWKKRLRAWEKRYLGGAFIPKSQLMILPMPVQVAHKEEWLMWRQALARLKPSLVIMDTQARVTVGISENDATEMGIFVERLEQIRRETGACVVTVHHLGHEGTHGRGSTAVVGALGSEIRVKKTGKGQLTVECEKQKDTEEFEPMNFKLETVVMGKTPDSKVDSAVPVPDGWAPAVGIDEFDAPIEVFRGVDANSSLDERISATLWRAFPVTGATQTQCRAVMVDEWVYGRGASKGYFSERWNALLAAGHLIPVLSASGTPTKAFTLSPRRAQELNLPMLRPVDIGSTRPGTPPAVADPAPEPAPVDDQPAAGAANRTL